MTYEREAKNMCLEIAFHVPNNFLITKAKFINIDFGKK